MTTRRIADHGTLSRYKYHRCRCDLCRACHRDYQRTRYRRKGYGTWQPLVDAEPIRQHLLALRAQGIAATRVAEACGLHGPTVTGFLYGSSTNPRKERASREIAARILAVTADQVVPGRVPAVGTARRIQALAATGWPMKTLGPHIGVHPATVARLTRQDVVYATTATAVAGVYDRLGSARPEDHGVSPTAVARAKRQAQRVGWPDPTWWEDYGHIDDPGFDPATAERGETGGNWVYAEVAYLASCGTSVHEIATRLGRTENYVKKILNGSRGNLNVREAA